VKRNTIIGIAAMALAACAGSPEKDSVLAKNDAVDDYIEVAELKAVDQIRHRRDLHHKQITEHYIVVYDGKVPHLVAFERKCYELNEVDVKPDFRYESRSLRARFDTYRGCKIRNIYEVTPGQAVELLEIGESSTQ